MKNWQQLAEALSLKLPAADVERMAAFLGAIDDAMSPVTRKLTPDMEPAFAYRPAEDAE